MEILDQQLLNLLKEDARHSNEVLANRLNVTVQDVESRIEKLKRDKVIRQFTTIIDENIAETFSVKALVELTIRPQKDSGYDSIAKRIYNYSNVVSHYLVSGQYDFLVVVEGKTHKEISHFVFDKLATLEHVMSTTTHFIFKCYKDQGILFNDSENVNRVAIMP